jgi:hypothetical protein
VAGVAARVGGATGSVGGRRRCCTRKRRRRWKKKKPKAKGRPVSVFGGEDGLFELRKRRRRWKKKKPEGKGGAVSAAVLEGKWSGSRMAALVWFQREGEQRRGQGSAK